MGEVPFTCLFQDRVCSNFNPRSLAVSLNTIVSPTNSGGNDAKKLPDKPLDEDNIIGCVLL